MPMSCCHYSFWCNYRPKNTEVDRDNENNSKFLQNFDKKEEAIFKVKK